MANALLRGEIVRQGKLGRAPQAILLDLPLFGEDELVFKPPAIDLALNVGKLLPRRNCHTSNVRS